jgi:MbtH protein
MYNPFENEQGNYLVLINEEEQYSLWPAAIEIPDGWNKEYGPKVKSECQQYIEQTWQDMRPNSLRYAMNEVMT